MMARRHHSRHARFRFYEELNDLLPAGRRKRGFDVWFSGAPSVKDVIESLGVPHTEVDLIVVNGESVGFDYHVRNDDVVAVYPMFEAIDISPVVRLRPAPLRDPRFIVDGHLGKLARRLRLLGFDTLYRRDYADDELVGTALREGRIILTRARGVLKRGDVTRGYCVRSSDAAAQVREVVARFDLAGRLRPFRRCTLCNGTLQAVDLADVQKVVPPRTAEAIDSYARCTECGKVYWPGTHYDRIRAWIESLRKRD